MQYSTPLISGTLIKRYKRFLADIRLDDGTEITAHCANSGKMLGIVDPGLKVWVSKSDNLKRKHAHTLEIIQSPEGTLVGANTGIPNKLVGWGLEQGIFDGLKGYDSFKAEVKINEKSRLDYALYSEEKPTCYVEIKNCHLRREGTLLEFPDAVTTRGAKHLHELIKLKQDGYRAVMLYIGQRDDCDHFQVAADLDPGYKTAFDEAVAAGVEVYCYGFTVTPEGLTLHRKLLIGF